MCELGIGVGNTLRLAAATALKDLCTLCFLLYESAYSKLESLEL